MTEVDCIFFFEFSPFPTQVINIFFSVCFLIDFVIFLSIKFQEFCLWIPAGKTLEWPKSSFLQASMLFWGLGKILLRNRQF